MPPPLLFYWREYREDKESMQSNEFREYKGLFYQTHLYSLNHIYSLMIGLYFFEKAHIPSIVRVALTTIIS